jgi:hypothetical protein
MNDLAGNELYTLEDMVYDSFHEATQQGSASYDTEEYLDIFHVAESIDPGNLPEVDREDELVGVAFVDQNDKAAYGFVDYKGEEVELDIKSFGDRFGVVNYIENLPSGGYTEGVETVSGDAWQNAAVEADEHPLNVETETELPEPGETTDEGFTNSQAERIKKQVLDEEPRT